MKLLLKRGYGKYETRSILYHGFTPWCRFLEPALNKYNSSFSLVPDGIYRIVLIHHDGFGWFPVLINSQNKQVASIRPLRNGQTFRENCLSPVTGFGDQAKFSKLAFLKLLDKLSEISMDGEEIFLEIVSSNKNKMIPPWSTQKALSV